MILLKHSWKADFIHRAKDVDTINKLQQNHHLFTCQLVEDTKIKQ